MESVPEMKPRPTFLVVLCTLSFIAGTWGLVANFSNYENAASVSTSISQTMDETRALMKSSIRTGADQKMMDRLFTDFSILTDTTKIKQSALLGILSNILTLIGVLLMYRMRKKGFGFYIMGIGVYIGSPILVYGLQNLAGMSFFLLSLLIGLLFSVFYLRTLKYMA